MPNHGFKHLTIDNWLNQDEALSAFVKLLPNGEIVQKVKSDWAQPFFEPTLSQFVPDEVQRLFEVARGAIVYGYFFYPLYTLGCEQLFRVAETAINFKFERISSVKKKNFEYKINFLCENGHMTSEEKDYWHNIRQMRNQVSHPKSQMILMPKFVVEILANIVIKIDCLFK